MHSRPVVQMLSPVAPGSRAGQITIGISMFCYVARIGAGVVGTDSDIAVRAAVDRRGSRAAPSCATRKYCHYHLFFRGALYFGHCGKPIR